MAERRFQFWENFYRPLTRIRDRAARAELALKLLEAAFEDEPPEFDDMEGLVADAVVPLILKDVGGKRPGRPKKCGSQPVGIPGGEGETFPETISETISKTVSEGPYKAKRSEAKGFSSEKKNLSASPARGAGATGAAPRAGKGVRLGAGWEKTGCRCRKCRRHLAKAPNGIMACPSCEPELTGMPAPGLAAEGDAA